ncbi:MerR family transcriptional regulator [Albimonas pacifica]|uniref:DNA-binding transcriptional regulator, MerR family n=1 Tax=Albimonas pacifica TaxID=1114924 RepID=A0A1I3HJT4_9RHOB|nr:MerR family transcriptional regulator [Albimonas pacifica]SFI35942.1 DNA-binding transcriptional regulator, MerR family [Albimonas pacifica]
MTAPAPAAAPATLTIAEAAERFGLTPRTLRFWEYSELIEALPRQKGGSRFYGPDQVARIARIVRLRRMRFSLSDILDLLKLEAAGDDGAPAAARLRMLKARAAAIEAEIEDLTRARHLVGEERFALHQAGAADDAPADPRPVLIEGEAHAWPA